VETGLYSNSSEPALGCKMRKETHLDWLVQYSDVVSELEGHSEQYDEAHPNEIERQALATSTTTTTTIQFNYPTASRRSGV